MKREYLLAWLQRNNSEIPQRNSIGMMKDVVRCQTQRYFIFN